VFFAFGAFFFGVGIILMANVLQPQDLGVVALFLVLLRLGSALGPVGLEVLLIRARPEQDVIPFKSVIVSSGTTTILTVAIVAIVYDFSLQLSIALSLGLVSATFWRMFLVLDQSRNRSKQAMALSQLPNVIALIMGMLAMLGGLRTPGTLCSVATAGYISAALLGWRLSHAKNWKSSEMLAESWKLTDRLSLAGLGAAAMLLAQIERFLIPRVLTFEDLALFAAVASLAVAPLKLLTAVSKFYLIPLVVAADTSKKLLNVIFHQGIALGTLAFVACLVVLTISPWLWDRILPATYNVDNALVLAILAIGVVRLYVGIVITVLSGASNTTALFISNVCAWICLGISATVATLYSHGQLTTFIWILAIGIACYGVAATALLVSTIRSPNRTQAITR
jgi:O-antigen/teichoic acid export membrane protein